MKHNNRIDIGLISHGNLLVKLAATDAEKDSAFRLRKRVFVKEIGAKGIIKNGQVFDDMDQYADILIAIDTDKQAAQDPDFVVGSYRLSTGTHAFQNGHYVSQTQFKLDRLVLYGDILELSRACVAPEYRCLKMPKLLWTGIGRYIHAHSHIAGLMGCVSLPDIDTKHWAPAIAYLQQNHGLSDMYNIRSKQDGLYALRDEDISYPQSIETIEKSIPPHIKAFIDLGAQFSNGAHIDCQFNTIDLFAFREADKLNTHSFYGRTLEQSFSSAWVAPYHIRP